MDVATVVLTVLLLAALVGIAAAHARRRIRW